MINKYITLRTEAISRILSWKASSANECINDMLCDLFYDLVKEDFSNMRAASDSDLEFFRNISGQANKLSWGEWCYQEDNGSMVIKIKNCPFRISGVSDKNEIGYHGPLQGILRACMTAINWRKIPCVKVYENQNEIIYDYIT